MFLSASGILYSQESDFGLWYEVNVGKSLNKKFDLEASVMVRTFDNGSKIDQGYFEAGATYNLNKYVGFAASYRIGNYLDDDDLYHIRHKWFGDIKGSLSLKHLHLSARLRLQVMERVYVEHPSDNKAEYDGRFKLRGIYKIPKFPVDPYASFETFSPVFRSSGHLIDKSRTTVGLEYKINKKNFINTEYIYQRDNSPDLSIMHIIDLSYTFKF
jgi:predicted porin